MIRRLAIACLMLTGCTTAPQLWLPGLVSTANSEVRIAFSPDGTRMLWGCIGCPDGAGGWDILESVREKNGSWGKPHHPSFDSAANDFDPFFAPDGSGVYFFSNRDGGLGKDDIYFAPFERERREYAPPINLGPNINSAGDEWAPSLSADGQTLLFATDGRGGAGKHDLFLAHREGNGWSIASNATELNTAAEAFDATFLSDGSIVLSSGDFEGRVALYLVPWRDHRYGSRVELGDAVNAKGKDAWTFGPAVNPREPGVLYFTSHREPGAGRVDIYRIRLRVGQAPAPVPSKR